LTGNQDKRQSTFAKATVDEESKKTKVKGAGLRAQSIGQKKIKVKRYAI